MISLNNVPVGGEVTFEPQVDDENSLVVEIPCTRKSVAHLPEVFKDITVLQTSDGRELRTFIDATEHGTFGYVKEMSQDLKVVDWTYQEDGTFHMASAFLRDLPHWIKVEDQSAWIHSEKGIPLMQACKAMLFNAMDLKNKEINRIAIFSINSRTALEVNNGLLNGDSLEEACKNSHSAYLVAELGQMLDRKVELVYASREKIVPVQKESFTAEHLENAPFSERPISINFLPSKDKEELLRKVEEFSNRLEPDETYKFVGSIAMEFIARKSGVS